MSASAGNYYESIIDLKILASRLFDRKKNIISTDLLLFDDKMAYI